MNVWKPKIKNHFFNLCSIHAGVGEAHNTVFADSRRDHRKVLYQPGKQQFQCFELKLKYIKMKGKPQVFALHESVM
jgi:hypothetical protein